MTSLESNTPESQTTYDKFTNEIWEPTALILDGTTIYAESTDSVPEPLYHLSRAVAFLTVSTKEVEFERIERTTKTNSDERIIKPRSRHIYTLKYITKVPGGFGAPVVGWESPRVFIQSVSRRTIGHLGIKRSRFLLKKGLKVVPIDLSAKKCATNNGLTSFDKDVEPMFLIQPKAGGGNMWVWTDGNGKEVAVEDRSDHYKLKFTVSLHRGTIDALVALWCGRIWEHSDENATPLEGGLDRGTFSGV